MNQFRGADWGEALGKGVLRGIAIGNQIRESKAQYDYGKASGAAKGAYDTAMKEAGDDVAKQDAARRAFNTSMNQAAFDYNKYTGRINEADAAQRRMTQEDFRAGFMQKYDQDHGYYDKAIVDDLNTDTMAKVTGTTYSINKPGELTISQGGKPVQTLPITDQMRAPFLQNLQDMEYAKYSGGGLGQQPTAFAGGRAVIQNAQDPKNMRLGGALGGGTPDPTVPSGEVAGGETQLQTGRPQGMITADNIPVSYRDQYNTRLSPEDEAAYQAWAKKNGRENDVEDYDMRGAWLEAKQKGVSLEDGRGHFPDTYKKPNHPTFSDQSKYNGEGGVKGGTWSKTEDGRDVFTPNRDLSPQEQQSLKEYFAKNEPNAVLNLGGDGAQVQAQQARPTPIQQARAARPQQGVATTPNGTVSLNRQGHPTSAAEDAQAMLDAIRNGTLPKEMKPFYEFMVKNEARMQAYYNAFARAFGHWPTDYEKDKMLNIAKGAEEARHNKAAEDLARRGQDLSFLKPQKNKKPEEYEVTDEPNQYGGRTVINSRKFPMGTLMEVQLHGSNNTNSVVAPYGWTKERTTDVLNGLIDQFDNGVKDSRSGASPKIADIRTDPVTMQTYIYIGNKVFTLGQAEKMLQRSKADTKDYKKSDAALEDLKTAKDRAKARGDIKEYNRYVKAIEDFNKKRADEAEAKLTFWQRAERWRKNHPEAFEMSEQLGLNLSELKSGYSGD